MFKSEFILINKTSGLSSQNLIKKIKINHNLNKIGFCGTLDPIASGLMIVLTNNMTKLSDLFTSKSKTYYFKIKLFYQTNSFDISGRVIKKDQFRIIDNNLIDKVINKYNGLTYNQTPPIYSAIKVNGKKLHHYARLNIDIELKQRKINIYSCKLLSYSPSKGELFLKTTCSKGTYIRSLAVDITNELNTIGCISFLKRTKIDCLNLNDAYKISDVINNQYKPLSIYNLAKIYNWKILKFKNHKDHHKSIKNGNAISLKNITENLVFFVHEGEIISIYQKNINTLETFNCKNNFFNSLEIE